MVQRLKSLTILFLFCLAPLSTLAEERAPEALNSSIIQANGLAATLALSPALIDQEIEKLSIKPVKLSKKKQNQLKEQLLARYHPSRLEKLLIQKLNTKAAQGPTALSDFYQGALAKEIRHLKTEALQEKYEPYLLEYEKKLALLPAQSQRKKLIIVLDKLSYESAWQTELIYRIQQSALQSLPEKAQGRYEPASKQAIEQQTLGFNNIVNMYSLRHLPSDQIIEYLDGLHEHSAKMALFDSAFKEMLIELQELQLINEK